MSSSYGKLFGIPLSLFGLAANLALFFMLLFENKIPFLQENNPIIIFGATVFTSLFSIWLIYVQAFILKKFCLWCLWHELAVFTLFGLSAARLRNYLAEEVDD